jgi:nicotinamidase-related amidase
MAWNSQLDDWPRALTTFRLKPSQTALLVIDVQRYCADPSIGLAAVVAANHPSYASYAFPRLKEIVLPNIARLIAFFRERGLRIIFFTNGPEYPDGADIRTTRWLCDFDRQRRSGAVTIFPKGSSGHAIMPEVAPKPDELVFNKRSTSAFVTTGIDHLLRVLGVSNVICTGLTTESCVESTARNAVDLGYGALMVEDACQTFEKAAHEWSLRNFARNFGRVADTNTVIHELSDDKT